jgi:lipoprotein-anchoring transpeptidase ErfK/SrfK
LILATAAACSALLIALADGAHAVPANAKAPLTADSTHQASPPLPRARLGDAGTPKDKPAGHEHAAVDTATPGPLSIIVSLDQQQLTLYSDGEPIAVSRVSSGRPGHSTPTGVFSIIEKDRWHHSNLYEDAPMYFMQRLTWSGVALHQGVVPDYPASHGCIRLPEAFAQRLWRMTKLGVRVIVTHRAAEPVAISHPRLFQPAHEEAVAAGEPVTPAQRVEAAFNNDASQRRPSADVKATPSTVFAQNLITPPAASTSDGVNSAQPPAHPIPQAPSTASLKPGPISVLISRKEGRLFVRKGFQPVFDVPVSVERPAEPIGTHVFTALAAKGDPDTVQWTVVTVPDTEAAKAKAAGANLTAATALDRVTLPADAVDRISSLMSAGASLIITDQGLGPETGAGTDFIVLTR